MQITRRQSLSMLGATAAAGLAGGHAGAQARASLDVVHWWITPSEQNAFREIRDRVEAKNITWVDTPLAGQDLAKTTSVTRVLGGQPPGIMMWHVGKDLSELLRDGVTRDLDTIAKAGNWDAALPASLQAFLKTDGRYNAVPLNVHGYSWMFSNKRVLADAKVETPKDYNGLIAMCETLKGAGVIPIAQGGTAWQEAAMFTMIVMSTQGPDLWDQVFVRQDTKNMDLPRLQAALESWVRLKQYCDRIPPGRSWADALNMMGTGKAGVFLHGDWAKGELASAGRKLGTDYNIDLVPGTDGMMLVVADCFCFSNAKDPAVRAAQDIFGQVVMDKEAAKKFVMLKGGFPARSDIALDELDANARQAAELMRGGARIVPSYVMCMKANMRTALYDVLTKFWNAEQPNAAAAARDIRTAIERTSRA